MRVAGYCRLSVSTDESVSIDGQRSVIERWAAAQDSTISEYYVDEGFSGSKDIERPAYDRLSADVEAGFYDVVAVKSLDRLGRRLRAFIEFADLAQRSGCRIVAVESGLDTGTPTGRMMLSLLSVFAEHEAAQMGERQKVSQEQRRKVAGRALGKPGFGFRNVKRADGSYREIDPEQAVIVREIAARLTAGGSYSATAGWLNERGIRSSKGATFSAAQVSQMILNPALNGQRMHKGQPIRDESGLPVIDEDLQILDHTEWAALMASLSKRKSFAPRTRTHRTPQLLSGLLHCAGCGKPMIQTTANGHPAYRCVGTLRRVCPRAASVKSASVHAFVLEQFEPLRSLPITEWRLTEDREAIERRTFLQREIDVLAGSLSSVAATEVVGIAERITRLREQADAIRVERRWEQIDTGQTFAEMLETDPRRVLDIALERIEIRKAKSSHEPPEPRTTLIWREHGEDHLDQ
jgi:site-specific DNA recombinase